MAGTGEVQYLQESQEYYGDSKPPFVRVSGDLGNKRTVRLVDTGRLQAVHYRSYPSVLGNFSYGAIQMKGFIYIVRALPKDWKRGDSTDVGGGCREWFAWQGPDHEFRGPLFDGPIARSAHPFSSWKTGNTTKRQTKQAAPAADASPSKSSRNSPREVRFESRRDSSPLFFEVPPDSNHGSSHATSHPDAVEVIGLTSSQEYSTTLHIKIHKDRETYFSLRLSSARPQTDPNSAVTNESLFQKITRTANRVSPSLGEIQVLEATFHAGLLHVTEASDITSSGKWPDLEPLMIIRGEEDTFECFQSHVLAFNKLDDKISWYVDLRVITE